MKKVKVIPRCILLLVLLSSCQFKAPSPVFSSEKNKDLGEIINDPQNLIKESRQLTFVGSKAGEGYFSPDGEWMIFQSEREPKNPFYQMYLMNLKTGHSERISPGVGKTTCGWIHPGQKKVLFSSTHLDPLKEKKAADEFAQRRSAVKARYAWSFDDTYDIFSSDFKGRHLKRLTREKGYDAEASYSPDGQWIVFASNRLAYSEKLSADDQKIFDQDPSYMMDIYRMKSDGSEIQQLTTSRGYDGGPFFSADGTHITWRRFSPNGSTAEIWTMKADGRDQKQITNLKAMSWAPFFHPSGDYLIFTSSILGYANFELFIVDTQGKQKPVRVTFDEGFDGLPVFTPDGNQISWTRRSEKGDSQILLADWDDAKARELLKLPAQDPLAGSLSPEIRVEDVKKWIYYLAQNSLQGRATGSPEEKIYTDKLIAAFKSWGYVGAGPKGSFLDTFEFTSGVSLGSQNQLELVGRGSRKYILSQDYEPLSFSKTGSFKAAPLVFAGYGIKAPASDKETAYNSYEGLDVKGKWVLIFSDLPADIENTRRQYLNLYARLQHKLTVARNEGAIGVLVTNAPNSGRTNSFGKMKYEGALSESQLAVLRFSEKAAQELLAMSGQKLSDVQKKLDQGANGQGFSLPSMYLQGQIDLQFQKSQGLNVLAKIPVPSARKGIMIGAHGDHLGHGQFGNSLAKADEKGRVHAGADDNASGVAGVMELAHALAQSFKKNPQSLKKNLYFAIWSGEELGNLGSGHYARNLPTDLSAYLNMDMIGRLKDRLYVQGAGSAGEWTPLLEEVAVRTAQPITVQEDPYLPTDSLSFYLAGLPTLTFFTGSHAEYHSPRDTAETIHYPGVVRVLNVVKEVSDLLTDTTVPMVTYVKVAGSQGKLEGRGFRVYLGTVPDYTQEGVKGVKLSGVSKDSPAEAAGLRSGDVIVMFDGVKVENLYDYVYTLQAVKPQKETSIQVQRAGEILDLRITPKLKD